MAGRARKRDCPAEDRRVFYAMFQQTGVDAMAVKRMKR
jgi:hypothetical protein